MPTRRKQDDAAQPLLPTFTPVVRIPHTLVPLANGRFEIIPGKPIVTTAEDEISTQEFSKLTGLSQRHVVRLCDEGKIAYRRKSPLEKSEYLIPRTEAERYRNIT